MSTSETPSVAETTASGDDNKTGTQPVDIQGNAQPTLSDSQREAVEDSSGDDVDVSSASEVATPDETKVTPVIPGNVFQQYASTLNAADAAARFTPKGDTGANPINVVRGDSAVLDGNADRKVAADIHEAMHTGIDTRALEAQRDAGRVAVLNVRAPLPVFRSPEEAAGQF